MTGEGKLDASSLEGKVVAGVLAWASDFTANSGNYLDLRRWSAINADLTITLARAPQGEWTGVATRAWYALDGIGHARADLFDGATWFLTPLAGTEPDRFRVVHGFVTALGARPVAIDPDALLTPGESDGA